MHCTGKIFDRCYRAAKCVTGNRHDADEAIEKVFVRVFEGQPSRVFRENPIAYLCKAAMNEARNRGLRKLKKLMTTPGGTR